jgi:DNA invertase Pin-like site-specific DNA recombinase
MTPAAAERARRRPLAAYLRVSTDQQAEHGLGLDVQRDAIRAWAKREGHRIAVWTSDEGVSGSNGLDARVGLLDALGALQAGTVHGIVVYRLDRLARDLVVQETLLGEVWRAGGRVFSTSASEDSYLDADGADADPSRALIRQILGAVAQYERAMIRLRLRSGKVRKAAAGGFIGGTPPLGWRAEGGKLVQDPDEQRVRARVLELRTGGASLREIGRALDTEGLRPKRGGAWHPQQVRAVLAHQGSSSG